MRRLSRADCRTPLTRFWRTVRLETAAVEGRDKPEADVLYAAASDADQFGSRHSIRCCEIARLESGERRELLKPLDPKPIPTIWREHTSAPAMMSGLPSTTILIRFDDHGGSGLKLSKPCQTFVLRMANQIQYACRHGWRTGRRPQSFVG